MTFVRSLTASTLAAIVTAFIALTPGTANAEPIAACGNVDFSGASGVSCDLQTSGGCTADCSPINCAASVSGSCSGGIEASCTGGCTGSCMADCTADPGSFSCSANCSASCMTSCTTQCSAAGASATCMADCQSSCTGQCNVSCNGTPPSATCDAQCQASCNGSCEVQNNLMCEVTTTASCTGGCNTQCSDPTGALFCDFGNGLGEQYIPVTDLSECETALAGMVTLNVSGAASCTGNNCNASVSACSVSPLTPMKDVAPAGLALVGLGLVAAGVARSRRNKKN